MVRTRSSVEGGGVDGAMSAAVEALLASENRLLRQLVQDLSGQLAALTDVIQQIARQKATPAAATQLSTPEPVVPEAHAPATGGDDGTPTQTTTARASAVLATAPPDVPPFQLRGRCRELRLGIRQGSLSSLLPPPCPRPLSVAIRRCGRSGQG